MDYKQMVKNDRLYWTGKKVLYIDGNVYTVTDVDYNGALLIDKKAEFTDTTAVSRFQVQEV